MKNQCKLYTLLAAVQVFHTGSGMITILIIFSEVLY
jgi:hypothetical protein